MVIIQLNDYSITTTNSKGQTAHRKCNVDRHVLLLEVLSKARGSIVDNCFLIQLEPDTSIVPEEQFSPDLTELTLYDLTE